MKLVNKKKVPSLDAYIELYKINDYCHNFDSAMSKLNKITNRRLKIALIPGGILIALWLMTGCSLNFLLILATSYIGGNAIFYTIKDSIAEEKAFNKMDEIGISANFDLFNATESLGYTKQLDDYYTEEFKQFRNTGISLEDEKYNQVVEEQTKNNLDDNEILGLDESASEIAHHLELYYKAYKLPKLTISNAEWDLIFDCTYDVFKEKEITSVYFQSISEYFRVILSKVLLSEKDSITLEDFTNDLDILAEIISYSTPVKLESKEISALESKIKTNAKSQHRVIGSRKRKVVNISDYQKKRTLK